MTRKIFRSILTVGVAVLACSLLLVMGCFYSFYEGMQEHQLGDELRIAAAAVEANGSTYLEKIKSDRFRVTWIASDGTVLYDTQADAAQMENHLEREEVREALETGTGSSSRYSATLLQKTVYSASRLTDGTVLRLSASRATMGALLLGAFQPILLVVIVLLVLSSLLASRLAKRIVEPLNALDLEHPLENDAYEELSPLLRRIDRQRRQIDAQLAELRQKTDEFTQITAGMNEGLVLLDEKGAVLNINPAAQTLFGVTGACVGQDFLTVDREHSMSLALRTAMTDGHSEVRAERGGREYQFDLSRIESDGKVVGAVLLAFDMTAQAFAERSRREFTANVSHELKTPLQGIIGSAELLENGMVKPEDMPRFVGHIRAEAQRLVTLIGDIIRLSELDEGGELPTETVDLLPLAQEAAENLRAAAEAKGVTVTVSGENAPVTGVRRLLYEIVYNLCDNAIKYNADGGSVDVRVGAEGGSACLTVRDTGIGLSPDEAKMVFSRFWRADAGRTRESGGLGIGLSVVKEIVDRHNGYVDVEGEKGVGACFTINLPLYYEGDEQREQRQQQRQQQQQQREQQMQQRQQQREAQRQQKEQQRAQQHAQKTGIPFGRSHDDGK